MNLRKLLSFVRKACDTYDMIEDGDKIGVGISGGKDSLTLLYALSELKRFYPKKFELEAITVSLGFKNFDITPVKELCAKLDVNYTIVETDIAEVVFDIRKESNPCALCSKMRKGALNTEAKKLGVNKIALGHNKDDICQSFLMSLIYEGRIHTFAPVTYLDRMDLYSIRPLMFVPEAQVVNFVNNEGISVVKSPCPADGHTKREVMKQFIYENDLKFDSFCNKIFTAILGSDIKGYGKDER